MKGKSFLGFVPSFILVMLLGLSVTSCGFINDLFGGDEGEGDTYNLEVYVEYYGSKFIGPSSPLLVATFDYGTEGYNSVAQTLNQSWGEVSFDREERAYGIIVFIDGNDNRDLDNGEVYQFYNNKSSNPDPIYLDDDRHIDIFLSDAYTWSEGFGFYEDFNDGYADNWSHDGRWYVSSGEYVMDGDMVYNWAYGYYDEDFSDFTYSVDVRQCSGVASMERGIIFRSSNPWDMNSTNFSGYLLGIKDDAGIMKWHLVRYDNGTQNVLQDWVSSSYLYSSMSTNTLEVTCSGSTITIYLNDNWIQDIYDPAGYSSGKVGLYARDDSAVYIEFRYDNADLY